MADAVGRWDPHGEDRWDKGSTVPAGPRYRAVKVHMTAMQKRLYPEAARKLWAVRDEATGALVGLPDRYRNQSGAQDRADRENALQSR